MVRAIRRLRFRRDHRWTPAHLSAFVDGDLAARGRARVLRHVRDCPECRRALQTLERMLELIRAVGPAERAGSAPDADSAEPDRLDRTAVAPAPSALAAAVRRRLHDPPET